MQKDLSENGLIGTVQNGVLIPPTVSMGKDTIAIGTHEVTQAQFHAFTGKSYDRLYANAPITGLGASEITAYLNWLKEKTGVTYRLPNAKEAEALHKKARESFKTQNNLNHWAGYELTALDVPDLQQKLKEIKTPLIQNAGSQPMVKLKKDVMVYDLGGNAAEYYQTGSGLKTYDYSAYDFVDPAAEGAINVPGHTGFRVVRE
jgi:formylglycine-generating enzyme required for sulfatase activity